MKVGRLVIAVLVGVLLFSVLSGISIGQDAETVYIGNGDYYASGPFYAWESGDLWVNMTVVQGGNVDVYIMNTAQYNNAYSYYEQDAPGGIAFKSSSQENVSQANIHIHVEVDMEDENWMEDEIWVVVDNRDAAATPDDASPTGTVRVQLEVDWYGGGYGDWDDFFWLEGVFCIAGSLVPTVLIIALLFLIYRKIDKKNQVPPQYQQPYYPPPFYPPYGGPGQEPPPGEGPPPES